MKIGFHGAAETVTGSQHLIHVNGLRILLDCGLYQGRRAESHERNQSFPFDPASIDVLVLSHAHIDHSGNIPNLVKQGFQGDILCSHATRDLCTVMLRDSGNIQERDAEYVNKKNKKKGLPPVEPIYTEVDALEAMRGFQSIGFDREREIAPGVVLRLIPAGHMLGAATVVLDITDQEAKRDLRLVFSGDIGRPEVPILLDPVVPERADILIMESTYGGRTHPPLEESENIFEDMIVRTHKRGGKVIVPAFAVGRTQQIVYTLNKLHHAHEIPNIKVFVDSPLAVNATEVFRLHPEAMNTTTMTYMTKEDPDGDVFSFPGLQYVRQVQDSKAINFLREPAVIISASGMMEHGRILHHLKNNVEDARNTVLIVGWQAPNTLGRRLVEGEHEVRIFGEEYTARAEVVVLNGFSGHADHNGLIAWAEGFREQRPDRVFLVHGEPDAAGALRKGLTDDAGYRQVDIPRLNQEFEIA